MNLIEALILGLIQGLTEFLPVSSSGHLELGEALLGIKTDKSLIFTVVVHGATVLSTLVVFRKEILEIILGLLKFKWNEELKYTIKLIISMIPVLILGLFFKEEVEAFFNGRIIFVGSMLLFTAVLLASTLLIKTNKREISYLDSLIIGIAQSVAVLPGISRSGATIATGLLLGDKKVSVTKFSFLMVLVPIIGANLMDLKDYQAASSSGIGAMPLLVGFVAAFIAGLLACKWMIGIVKKGNLLYFAIYCLIIGLIAIFAG